MIRKIFKSSDCDKMRFVLCSPTKWGVWHLRSIPETDRIENSQFSNIGLEDQIGFVGYGIFYSYISGKKYFSPVCTI